MSDKRTLSIDELAEHVADAFYLLIPYDPRLTDELHEIAREAFETAVKNRTAWIVKYLRSIDTDKATRRFEMSLADIADDIEQKFGVKP